MARDETGKQKIKWIIIRYPGDNPQGEEWWATLGCHQRAEYIEMEHDQFGQVRFEIKPPGQLVRLVIPGPAAAIEVGYEGESPKHGPPAPAKAPCPEGESAKWYAYEYQTPLGEMRMRIKDTPICDYACPRGNVIDRIGPYASYDDAASEARHFFGKNRPATPVKPPADYTKPDEFRNLRDDETFVTEGVVWHRVAKVSACFLRHEPAKPVLLASGKQYYGPACEKGELIANGAFCPERNHLIHFEQNTRVFRIPRKPEPQADSPYAEVCEFGDLAPGATFERRSRSDSDGSVVVQRWRCIAWRRVTSPYCMAAKSHHCVEECCAFNLATGRIDYFNPHDRVLRVPVEVPDEK